MKGRWIAGEGHKVQSWGGTIRSTEQGREWWEAEYVLEALDFVRCIGRAIKKDIESDKMEGGVLELWFGTNYITIAL